MRVSGPHYLQPCSACSWLVWQTRHGLGFLDHADLHFDVKFEGCGFTPPPPPSPFVEWQLAQSRSE